METQASPWGNTRGGACVVVGSQWGDEGKGKLVDILCATADLCIRAQGGDNAGHTIVHAQTKYDVHILPTGVVTPGCKNLIGSGCVIHIPGFFKEVEKVEATGVQTTGRILISDRAHVVFNLHRLIDGLEEVELGNGLIGTTKKGIGPTYSTKMTRSGIRIADVMDEGMFEEKLRRLAYGFQKRYGDLLKYNVEDEIAELKQYRDRLRPYVVDQIPILAEAKKNRANILIEGANAIMLDIDHGSYPFVTSSNTGVGGALTGLTIGWRSLREVIGVVKAYTTRVGSGPFPSEQLNAIGEKFQDIGKEFGVTTGRKRRTGWLDLVVLKHSHAVNDYTSLNVTKLDVLDTFDDIKVATKYRYKNEDIEYFPANLKTLDELEVVYETWPGWQAPTTGVRKFNDLPENARKYVERIEQDVGVPVRYIGTGPDKADMILR